MSDTYAGIDGGPWYVGEQQTGFTVIVETDSTQEDT